MEKNQLTKSDPKRTRGLIKVSPPKPNRVKIRGKYVLMCKSKCTFYSFCHFFFTLFLSMNKISIKWVQIRTTVLLSSFYAFLCKAKNLEYAIKMLILIKESRSKRLNFMHHSFFYFNWLKFVHFETLHQNRTS